MKLWHTFLRDLKVSYRTYYVYIELIMALLVVAVVLFVLPENFEARSTLYLHAQGVGSEVTDGFLQADDAVEIHLGHGYLPSEFLSLRLNRRTDEWGGSLENRARFPRAVVTAVREAVGDRLAVLAKLNMADGVRPTNGCAPARSSYATTPNA